MPKSKGKVNKGTAFVHVPVARSVADRWAKFRKEKGLVLLARDAEARGRGLTEREYLMERALVEYMASHIGD